ncbi:MAG: hypothetical protein ACLP59_18145 [Bryobacteraceae bacterium]
MNCTGSSSGNPCVLTGQYNNQRTAYNNNETALTSLTVGNSGSARLQQKMLYQVDPTCSGCADDTPKITLCSGCSQAQATFNPIYAQPLYVPSISVSTPANTANCNGSTTCSMLIAVTMNDTVFAWNAATGSLLWSRQGSTTQGNASPQGQGLFTDCGATSATAPAHPLGTFFEGIVSTPVIDMTQSSPTMFLTSLCSVPGGATESFLHAINIQTGADIAFTQIPLCTSATGSLGADGTGQPGCTSNVEFMGGHQRQRAAILEIDSTLYLAYGTRVSENNPTTYPYEGWVFGYSVPITSSSTPEITFDTVTEGTGSGGTTNTDLPACDYTESDGAGSYQNEPNWCGHGSGIWMSGRGPAASHGALADGNTHVFLGSGNGGFQQNGQNWGESIMDFRNGGTVDTSPFQSFTPHDGKAIQEPLLGATTCSGGGNCSYIFEALNQNDWDMAVSGVLAFDDLAGRHRLVSIDKAGFGYLFEQGNLCGGTKNPTLSQCPVQSFANPDPGNQFAFQASHDNCLLTPTGPQNTDCDRITSMAFANGYLYYWPTNFATGNDERLTALTLSGNSPITPAASPTITTDSTGTIIYGSSGATFNTWLIPGDQITANGQTVTVMAITSATQATVSPAFSPPFTTTGASFTYNGYFVNPAVDFNPSPNSTGYAGGSLVLTSNAGSNGVVWSVISQNVSATGLSSDTNVRTPGTLYAHNATPASSPSWGLQRLWDSTDYCPYCQNFCVSSFALPTVASGMVFVPTYSINAGGDTTQYCPTDTTSGSQDPTAWQTGILAYGH